MFETDFWYRFKIMDGGEQHEFSAMVVDADGPLLRCERANGTELVINATSSAFISAEQTDAPVMMTFIDAGQ